MHQNLWVISVCFAISSLAACYAASPQPAVTPPPLAQELVLYGWAGYIPSSTLDAFTAEYGVKVTQLIYENQEQAVAGMKAGQAYDVVVMGSHLVPELIADSLLAEIDYHNVPNFRNISPNFRDLVYDPGNKHSVLFEWGTTGILARQDLVNKAPTHWADLWNTDYSGKVGVWPLRRSLTGITLKSLGYSINSEKPEELQAAAERLRLLKSNSFMIDPNLATAVPLMVSGQAVMIYGWSYDAIEARQQNQPIAYNLPEEGTILWGDNFTIPANSPHKHTAELFINFMLRPEISAQFVNETFIATANEAADSFIKPELRNDPIIFPPVEVIKGAEWILPLSPAGQKQHTQIWQQFMNPTP